jgi:hypothetical protein
MDARLRTFLRTSRLDRDFSTELESLVAGFDGGA